MGAHVAQSIPVSVLKNWRNVLAKRREIMSRQRVDDAYMASWFDFEPVSKPAPKKFAAALTRSKATAALTVHSLQLPVRIAILGTRGIPANYGGFETFAEELSVTPRRARPSGDGLLPGKAPFNTLTSACELVYLPTIRHKYFDTLAHTFLSTLHLLFHRVDVALYCNAANAVFTILPRLAGIPVALNVDGIERRRKKWNALAQSLVPSLGISLDHSSQLRS